jgi:predicted amidohydrolase
MIIASAQTKPTRWNINQNLSDHYHFIELASEKGADIIIFPELSITGYEHQGVEKLVFTPTDPRLNTLRELASAKNIIIVAGAPIQLDSHLYIGSFVLKPNGAVSFYTKQFLHPGEEVFYSCSFDYNPLIELKGERISFAICADTDHPEHPQNACKVKASIYMPSIFFSPGGIPEAYSNLSSYAQKYSMSVLMSNFCGEAWGRPAGGGSAFWNNKGQLVGCLNNSDPGLLLAEKVGEEWKTQAIY